MWCRRPAVKMASKTPLVNVPCVISDLGPWEGWRWGTRVRQCMLPMRFCTVNKVQIISPWLSKREIILSKLDLINWTLKQARRIQRERQFSAGLEENNHVVTCLWRGSRGKDLRAAPRSQELSGHQPTRKQGLRSYNNHKELNSTYSSKLGRGSKASLFSAW